MAGRVLIVGATEGFIVKGLEAKLKAAGVASEFSKPAVTDIGACIKSADLIIVFTDEEVREASNALVYIKDFCSEHDKEVALIGTDTEYEEVKEYIPDTYLFKLFKRPLDMEVLVSEVETYMEEEAKQTRRKSILIVDDDVAYMSMISDWLKDKYRVAMANSGMRAITWLAKNKADLILLDYEMPITSGPQVLEMIRTDSAISDVPVMFLTAKSDKESIMKVLSLRPVGYQLKNIGRDQLRENIASFFALQKAKE